VIIRVNRGRLPVGYEGELLVRLQSQGANVAKPDGMLGGAIGRRIVDDRIELVAVTYWRDIAALEVAFGPNWSTPTTIAGFEKLLEDRVVEHFESFLDDVDALFGATRRPVTAPDDGPPAAARVPTPG